MSTADGGGAALDPTVNAQDGAVQHDPAADLDQLQRLVADAEAAVASADNKAAVAKADLDGAHQAQKDAAKALKDAEQQLARARKEAGN